MCLFLGSLVCLDRERWAGPCTPPLPMARASARQSSWRRCGEATRPASWETSRRLWSCTARPCAPTHRTASCTATARPPTSNWASTRPPWTTQSKPASLTLNGRRWVCGRGFVSFYRLQVETSLVLRSSSSCAVYCFFLTSEKQRPSLFFPFVLLAFIAGTASRELEMLPNRLFA